MVLCPFIKKCLEYKNKRKYFSTEKFKCSHKEHWTKCSIYLETEKEKNKKPNPSQVKTSFNCY